uniref:Uncharacterized protein n=1 Tax=Hyaloperonospora arabidopsidis (strain Emoy2) TaxID=559515 RepID=M4C4U9_HYAAE
MDNTECVNMMIDPFHLDMVYPLKDKSSMVQLDAFKICIDQLKAYLPNYCIAFLKADNVAEYLGTELAVIC